MRRAKVFKSESLLEGSPDIAKSKEMNEMIFKLKANQLDEELV